MNYNKYKQYFNTIKYLKLQQLNYRTFYFLRKKIWGITHTTYLLNKKSTHYPLKFIPSLHILNSYKDNNFNFLNLSHNFQTNIDWNYDNYGKLWTYNLNYFDYLSQNNNEENIKLIYDFIKNIKTIKDGLEPFPISLRGINWIKFLNYNNIYEKNINDSLYAQYYILLDNIEYHLLGNHLLENGFSLLFGAYYFQDEKLYKKAKSILKNELKEQILNDGGHFELSPMYHQIMLFRLLDSINLIKHNKWKDEELLSFLTKKATIMLSWLTNISYKNGDIPLLNDSANYIAPTTPQLVYYAKRLSIPFLSTPLSDSGYRKFSNNTYELIVDIGEIGASYIPGHAHSDMLNFELRLNAQPFIVDTGLSTYESNQRRITERSTLSHNTVEINKQNQSDVWGGFRVGNRAKIIKFTESKDEIQATHDGYGNVLHTRIWSIQESKIIIKDKLSSQAEAISRFHFAPEITKEEILKCFNLDNLSYSINTYLYAPQFNLKLNAFVLEIRFSKEIEVSINLNS